MVSIGRPAAGSLDHDAGDEHGRPEVEGGNGLALGDHGRYRMNRMRQTSAGKSSVER
jgi:hypothetical protein